MRVFIDTNILISAALFPGGVASAAYFKAISSPHTAVISDYVVDELKSVFRRKFPTRTQELSAFLAELSSTVEIVKTPDDEPDSEAQVRDPHDVPILRAACSCGADVLLTGDKDLLEAGIDDPIVVSAGDFLKRF